MIFFSFFFSFFVFVPKMRFALSQKYYVRNWTVTKFCDIGTGDFSFRFSAQKRVLFLSAFSFTAENERCIFGRPLHQTDSVYILRRWFSNIQQSWFRTAGRCLDKLVLLSILDISHPSSSSSSPSSPSLSSRSSSDRRCAPWLLTISDLHSVDSSRALASS